MVTYIEGRVYQKGGCGRAQGGVGAGCVRGWRGRGYLLTLLLCVLRGVSAIKEAPLEQLHGDDTKDELEEQVDNHDVDDVLQ